MDFSVGSMVIHARHGLGEIVQIEETLINGNATACYVVKTNNLTVWVPVDEEIVRNNLRPPTPKADFENVLVILRTPSEPLPEDRKERKSKMIQQLTDGSITSVCRLIRDLSGYSHLKKLSDDDKSILERAKTILLTEWAISLTIPHAQARKLMGDILPGA